MKVSLSFIIKKNWECFDDRNYIYEQTTTIIQCSVRFYLKPTLGIVVVLLSCQNAVPCLLGIFHTWWPPSHSGNSSHWRIPARHSLHLCGPYSSWYAPVGQGNSSVLECHWCTVLVIWLPSSICILIPSLQAGFAGGLPSVVLVLTHLTVQTEGVILSDVWAFVSKHRSLQKNQGWKHFSNVTFVF